MAACSEAVQTMLGHASAVLTLDTYAELFPDDLEMVSAALDDARRIALKQPNKHKQPNKPPATYWRRNEGRLDRISSQGLSPATTRVQGGGI
jgi:hypothetical protein